MPETTIEILEGYRRVDLLTKTKQALEDLIGKGSFSTPWGIGEYRRMDLTGPYEYALRVDFRLERYDLQYRRRYMCNSGTEWAHANDSLMNILQRADGESSAFERDGGDWKSALPGVTLARLKGVLKQMREAWEAHTAPRNFYYILRRIHIMEQIAWLAQTLDYHRRVAETLQDREALLQILLNRSELCEISDRCELDAEIYSRKVTVVPAKLKAAITALPKEFP